MLVDVQWLISHDIGHVAREPVREFSDRNPFQQNVTCAGLRSEKSEKDLAEAI